MSRNHAIIALITGAGLVASCTEVTTGPGADPITITLAPDVVELLVGETRQLSATVTGGAAGTARTVTFETSNMNVATVDANGLVRGAGPGSAQVVARSTADPSATDATQVTVEPQPAVISIERITIGGTMTPVDPSNVFGQIDVYLEVDPAGAGRAEVFVGQQPGCSTSAAADIAADASRPVEIVCSVQTNSFNAPTGAATFPNGPHSLNARLVGPTGTVVATAPSSTVVLNNRDFVTVTSRPANPCITVTSSQSIANGALWCSGDVVFDVISVNYGATPLAGGTVTLTTSGLGVTGAAGCRPTDDVSTDRTVASAHGGAGATDFPRCPAVTISRPLIMNGSVGSVTFPANAGVEDNGVAGTEEVFTVSVALQDAAGQPGPACINPDPVVNPAGPGCGVNLPTIPVDNLAPRVTQLNILRPNQYFNGSFVPVHTRGSGGSCTAPCARTADYGVDSQTATFLAGPAGSLVDVTAGFQALPETTANTNVFAMTSIDAVGNAHTVYATNAATVTTTSVAQAQLFGIDNTTPIATFSSGPPDRSTNCPQPPSDPPSCAGSVGWTVTFSDPGSSPSGFNQQQVRVKLERILASGRECLNPPTGTPISCTTNDGFVQYNGNPRLYPIDGFYQATVHITDLAGNVGAASRIALHDYARPTLSINLVGNIDGGETAQVDLDGSDNVAIGDVRSFYGFNGFNDLVGGAITVSTFGVNQLTSRVQGRIGIGGFIKSIEAVNAAGLPTGTVQQSTSLGFAVRDVAGVALRDACPPSGAADGTSTQHCALRRVDITNALAGNTFPAYSGLNALNAANPAHGLFVHEAPSQATVCVGDGGSCSTPAAPETVDFNVTIAGPTSTFTSPFDRVFFVRLDAPSGRWVSIGAATPTTTDNAGTRIVTYTFTWDPNNVPVGQTAIRAVGVDANGSALVSEPRAITLVN